MREAHHFLKEAEGVIRMLRPKELHEILVFAREKYNMDVIQGYLQGHQSVFKDVSGRLVVLGTID